MRCVLWGPLLWAVTHASCAGRPTGWLFPGPLSTLCTWPACPACVTVLLAVLTLPSASSCSLEAAGAGVTRMCALMWGPEHRPRGMCRAGGPLDVARSQPRTSSSQMCSYCRLDHIF